MSFYVGYQWLFHERIVVKVGDRIFESSTVPTYAKQNDRAVGAEHVFEAVRYPRQDNRIAEAIAEDVEAPVRVRFVGELDDELVLHTRDKVAIKESVELAQLLRSSTLPAGR